jgi:CRP-like cAMP-binding protein
MLIRSHSRDPYLMTLRDLAPFRGCSAEEMRGICRVATLVHSPRDAFLIDDATPAEFFVLVSGHVVVSQGGEWHTVLGPGDHFGEDVLVGRGTARLSVTALTEVDVLVMDRRQLHGVLRSAPGIAVYLLRHVLANSDRPHSVDATGMTTPPSVRIDRLPRQSVRGPLLTAPQPTRRALSRSARIHVESPAGDGSSHVVE